MTATRTIAAPANVVTFITPEMITAPERFDDCRAVEVRRDHLADCVCAEEQAFAGQGFRVAAPAEIALVLDAEPFVVDVDHVAGVADVDSV